MEGNCSVCLVDAKARRLYEALLSAGISVRDVGDFTQWWAEKHEKPDWKVTRSSLSRHRINHPWGDKAEAKPLELDEEVQTVQTMVREMLRRYQAVLKDPSWVPSDREMREWVNTAAKIADLEQRREEEQSLRALLSGIGYRPRVVEVHPALPEGS